MAGLAGEKIDPGFFFQCPGGDEQVFIAAAGQVDHHQPFGGKGSGQAEAVGRGMGRFQGGDYALEPGQKLESFQGFAVPDRDEFDPAASAKVGQLGADSGIIEAGAQGMGGQDLAVVVLKEDGFITLDDADSAVRSEADRVFSGFRSPSARLNPDASNLSPIQKRVEEAERVGSSPDASHQNIRYPLFRLQDLNGFELLTSKLLLDLHPNKMNSNIGSNFFIKLCTTGRR